MSAQSKAMDLPLELIHLFVPPPASLPRTVRTRLANGLQQHASLSTLSNVTAKLEAVAHRQRIEGNDELSEAVLLTSSRLREASRADVEGLLRPSRLPDVLQFLLELASPPTVVTLEAAHQILWDQANPEPPPPPDNWIHDVLKENLKGMGWDDIRERATAGRPKPRLRSPSSSSDEWTVSSSSSAESESLPTPNKPTRPPPPSSKIIPSLTPRLSPDVVGLSALTVRQYWITRPTVPTSVPFCSSNPSTLSAALSDDAGYAWQEVDVVREVLGALQGQETARVFRSGNEGIEVSIQGSLLHLSPASFRSLLATFLPSLTSLHILDTFVRRTISRTTTSLPYSWGRTIEAFAESIDLVLRSYRHRCVAQSLVLPNPTSDTIVSLLQLSHDIELRSKPLLQLVKAVELIKPDGQHPSETVSTLIEYLQSEVDLAYELGDEEAAEGLRAVFVRTVEPLWRSIGDWVRKGRLGERTDEFFVRRDGDIEIDAPEFLRDGFVSREKKAVPSMFGDVREGVLECGKVMHLLKTIGPDVEWLEDDAEWPRFGDLMLDKGRPTIEQDDTPVSSPLDIVRHALLRTEVATARPRTKTIYAPLPPFTSFSQSVADTISESCLPLFRVIQYRLHRVFLDECQFGHHLAAVQGIFLMRRGWEVGTFLGSVFERMDQGQSWSDYQLLNSSWSKAVGKSTWTDPTLVRFRVVAKSTSASSLRSVKVFANLIVEYSIPWPLVYVLRPDTMEIYSSIFTFLLQLRCAKHIIDRLSLAKLSDHVLPSSPRSLQNYYALRRKLTWIVSTLFGFFMFVVQKEVDRFKFGLERTTSVREMGEAHETHVVKLLDRLLLNTKAAPIHRSIISLLDLCISLSDTWTTLNIDPDASTIISRRRRPSHRRKSSDTSDSEDETTFTGNDTTTSAPPSMSFVSLIHEGFPQRLEGMEKEVNESLGFVRRGCIGLAKASTNEEVREFYTLLAFRLDE